MTMDVEAQIKQLKEEIQAIREHAPIVKGLANKSKEFTETDLYSKFQEWTTARSNIPAPIFTDTNSVVAFIANSFVAAGVRLASTYFEDVQRGPEKLKESLDARNEAINKLEKDLQADLSEWDVDDAEED